MKILVAQVAAIMVFCNMQKLFTQIFFMRTSYFSEKSCSMISYLIDMFNNIHFLTDVPDTPASVTLEVVGTKALKVKFTESESSREPETIVTKYKGKKSFTNNFFNAELIKHWINCLSFDT